MRVGVIRGDLPSPLFLGDLEPVSKANFPIDPVGQTRYLSRPDPTTLTNYLSGFNNDGLAIVGFAGVPAGVQSSTAVTFDSHIFQTASETDSRSAREQRPQISSISSTAPPAPLTFSTR